MVDSELSWQYVAGFFDGEGCVTHRVDGNRDSYEIDCSNSNLSSLKSIQKFINTGILTQDRKADDHYKALYRLRVRDHRNVLRVATGMAAFSIVKKAQLLKAITHISNHRYGRCILDLEEVKTLYNT